MPILLHPIDPFDLYYDLSCTKLFKVPLVLSTRALKYHTLNSNRKSPVNNTHITHIAANIDVQQLNFFELYGMLRSEGYTPLLRGDLDEAYSKLLAGQFPVSLPLNVVFAAE